VQCIETLGALGGTRYVYVYSRLLAAAAWKAHMQRDPLDPRAGAGLAALVLAGGARWAPQALVGALLGPGALVEAEGGWVPDLGADCYQDIDLLG
jgi:Zn-dependent oligopeptidase